MTDNLTLCSYFGISIQNDFKGVRGTSQICSFKMKNKKALISHSRFTISDHKCLDQNILIPNKGHAGCQEVNEINHFITFLLM